MPVATAKSAPLKEVEGTFRSPGQHKLVLGLLLVVVTLVIYNPVAHNGFVNFDDDRYVTRNPQVQAGIRWTTISWAFTSFDQANWHPLTWLSHALDCQIFHLNPVGHHYTSLLLHAINTLLLFLILQRFTGYAGRSLLIAALFALHPLNVESVAWVAERKNVLCMFFFLLAVAAYGWYVRRPGIIRYLLLAFFFALALMSKPMAITLPLVLLLLDYWPLERIGRGNSWKLLLEKIPLLALSAASAVVTLIAQRSGGAVLTSAAHAPLLRFENVAVCYFLYIKKAIWPSHLAVLYPYPHSLPSWRVAASALFLLAVTAVVLIYRERRYLLVGWFWYLLTMIPMIGLVQVGNQAMADRYAYLPIIGLFVLAVWSAAEWAKRCQLSNKYLAAAGLAIIVACSAITHVQIAYWHDDTSLWSHALAVTRNNYVAENNFAHALIQQNRSDEAIVHFRTASALEPDDPVSQFNLGIYAQEHGDLEQAATRYRLVLQLATDTDLRASAFANLGTVYFTQHDFAQAQQSFDSAAKLNHVFPIALLDMGLIAQKAAAKTGSNTNTNRNADDWNRAAACFAQYADLAPSDVAYVLLAHALHQAGRKDEADLAYQQALRLSPNITQTQQRVAHLLDQ
jgi:protein O-mannosyl-transferase